jgi:hypothetical protein
MKTSPRYIGIVITPTGAGPTDLWKTLRLPSCLRPRTRACAAGWYNLGEAYTPTIAERIRTELGYREIVSEEEGFLRTLQRMAKRRRQRPPAPH